MRSQAALVSHSRSNADVLGTALNKTKRFVYVNGAELTLISICWFCCSLLVISVGPATLGAYTAVASLYDNEGINAHRVIATVREQLISVTLLGLFPVVLASMAVLYAVHFLVSGTTLAGLLALVGAYGAVFASLVLAPSFVLLAQGTPLSRALRHGYVWTVQNPTLVLAVSVITAIIGCGLLVFVVSFPLLFAGVTCSFHTQVITTHPDTFSPNNESSVGA